MHGGQVEVLWKLSLQALLFGRVGEKNCRLKGSLVHFSLLDDFGPLAVSQPKLLHRVVVRYLSLKTAMTLNLAVIALLISTN